ncbi:MAG: hypothetical protein IKC97_01750 [Clostridia bacterium]|nr:hypothetical protein [Clostridia bacterium]
MFHDLNAFYEVHENGKCSDDADYSQDAKNHFVILEEGETLADVVPKSEVDRLTAELEEKSKRLREVLPIVAELKAEVAREILEEIKKTMNLIYSRVQHDCVGRHGDDPHTIMLVGKLNGIKYLGDEIAELKKKYTGVEDGDGRN